MKGKSKSESRLVVSDSLQPHGLYSPWNSPGQNPSFLCCRQIPYQLSHKGSPGILEWVAYPFSSGSSRPRNQMGVSCIAGGFFTSWPIREALGRADHVHLSWQSSTCYSCQWPGCALFPAWSSYLGQLEPNTSTARFCLEGEDEIV